MSGYNWKCKNSTESNLCASSQECDYCLDMDFVLTFEKECRKDKDFFMLNYRLYDTVKDLYIKWNN